MAFGAFPTIDTAMLVGSLDFVPLGSRHIHNGGLTLACTFLVPKGFGLVRMCRSPGLVGCFHLVTMRLSIRACCGDRLLPVRRRVGPSVGIGLRSVGSMVGVAFGIITIPMGCVVGPFSGVYALTVLGVIVRKILALLFRGLGH